MILHLGRGWASRLRFWWCPGEKKIRDCHGKDGMSWRNPVQLSFFGRCWVEDFHWLRDWLDFGPFNGRDRDFYEHVIPHNTSRNDGTCRVYKICHCCWPRSQRRRAGSAGNWRRSKDWQRRTWQTPMPPGAKCLRTYVMLSIWRWVWLLFLHTGRRTCQSGTTGRHDLSWFTSYWMRAVSPVSRTSKTFSIWMCHVKHGTFQGSLPCWMLALDSAQGGCNNGNWMGDTMAPRIWSVFQEWFQGCSKTTGWDIAGYFWT